MNEGYVKGKTDHHLFYDYSEQKHKMENRIKEKTTYLSYKYERKGIK